LRNGLREAAVEAFQRLKKGHPPSPRQRLAAYNEIATSRVSHSLVAALAFLVLPSCGTAQSPRRPSQADLGRAATRTLNEGRYDDVEALTEKRDPNIAAVIARAAIARGRYAQAEALLRPVALRVPSSEAALELGLLQHMLGRPDAAALLEKVAPLADTSDDPIEVARAARALRALGRFHEANAAYRFAAPPRPATRDSGRGASCSREARRSKR
jgi:tetratricopeptide (TPR) repeat protein